MSKECVEPITTRFELEEIIRNYYFYKDGILSTGNFEIICVCTSMVKDKIEIRYDLRNVNTNKLYHDIEDDRIIKLKENK